MIHPATRLSFIDEQIGFGVIVTERLPAGTITWVQDPLDQLLPADASSLPSGHYRATLEKYTFINRSGQRVLCWDIGRYMNHSCEANTFSPGLDFEIAIRDIEVGEQLTSDYGALNLEERLECRCGSPRCRGVVEPEDFVRLAPEWDAMVRRAFPAVSRVPQPLWDLVTERELVEKGIADPPSLPSILVHRVVAANGAAHRGENGAASPAW
ncbi:MAG: SET domain-containing protein-lysine N-methyltransferase [Deltaproteobacteria bacterium]|nr:SET domain-containing protein-lysine N-methyltransferase [Deltaproteobacteria bacterium]